MKMAYLFAVPMCLLSGSTMVGCIGRSELKQLLASMFAATALRRFHEWVASLPCRYRLVLRKTDGQAWLAPYQLKAILQELLPSRFGGKELGFTPTGLVSLGVNERDPSLRLSLLRRTKAMLIEHGVGFHLVFLLVLFASLWLSVKESMWRSGAKEEVWLDLVVHAIYPGLP